MLRLCVTVMVFSLLSEPFVGNFLRANEQEREIAGHLLEEIGKILIIREDQKHERKADEVGRHEATSEVAEIEQEKKKLPSSKILELKEKKQKKLKPHYVGSKRPQPEMEEEKKSSRLQNEWVVSKTYPKVKKKKEGDGVQDEEYRPLPPPRPFVVSHTEPLSALQFKELSQRMDELQSKINFIEEEQGVLRKEAVMKAPDGLVFFSLDYLFWTTKEEGLDFAIVKALPDPNYLPGAQSESVHFGWQSGVRAGLGVHLPTDHWDIVVLYTYFRPTASVALEGIINPVALYQAASEDFDVVRYATSNWVINFQTADLQIGKACPLSQHLLLRPFIGIKGAWINQKNTNEFMRYSHSDPYTVGSQNFFRGVGGQLGCQSQWQLGKGFSLFGDIETALLAGRFDLHQTQKLPSSEQGVVAWQDHINLLNPMLHYTTGIGWDRNFHQNKWHLGIQLGFEGQLWWDQNQALLFMDDVLPTYVHAQGNLSFYGLDLSLRFDF